MKTSMKRFYEAFCGRMPHVHPWHFQWLPVYHLHAEFYQALPAISRSARVLDVGCGEKPYRDWVGAEAYIGLDIVPGKADIVIADGMPFPDPADSYDVIFSSQVLEHVHNSELTIREMIRVLRPGGMLILAFPFLYNEHGSPCDYRRFTAAGAATLLPGCSIDRVVKLGGLGSTLGLLFLNGLFLNCRLLPIFIAPMVNALGWLVDRLDRSGAFYNNVLVIARKA